MTIRLEVLVPGATAITLFLRDEPFNKRDVKAARREFGRVCPTRRDVPFRPSRIFREHSDDLFDAIIPALRAHGLKLPSSNHDMAVVVTTAMEALETLSKWTGKETPSVRQRLRTRLMWVRTAILNFSSGKQKVAAD